MRILFMGTPEFAVPTLLALSKKHDVIAVVTQPDKPKGRGKAMQCSPVKEAALELGIPVLQPERIRKFTEELEKYEADVFVVIAYGQILSERILNMPSKGCINVHGSLLPKYRGSAPIQQAVINGDRETGVTIMYMDKGIDTGDMILKKYMDILPADTAGDVHDKMSLIGAEALLEALELIQSGEAVRTKQDDAISTYAPMLTKEMGHIDFSKSAWDIANLVRGLNPWPCAYTLTDSDEAIKIWAAEAVDGGKGEIGQVIDVITDKGIVVKAGEGAVLITELQVRNGKRMPTPAYLRGHKIDLGTVFK